MDNLDTAVKNVANEFNYDVSVIIPAYNEEYSIGYVVSGIKKLDLKCKSLKVIVVDDGSEDRTGIIARDSGADLVITHPNNIGYGAAIKTGVRNTTSDTIVVFDADGQHNPQDIKKLLEKYDGYSMVIGERLNPPVSARTFGKKLLTLTANYLTGVKIPDLNSGFRIFPRKSFLEFQHLFPNGFSITTALTLSFLREGYPVKFVPIRIFKRKGRMSNVKFFRDGFNTLILIVRTIMLFDPLKIFLPVSVIVFFIGLLYTVLLMLLKREFNIPDGAVFCFLSGILFFLFGLLADQISALRRKF